MYPNLMPTWMQWIDGRALLLFMLLIGTCAWYWHAVSTGKGSEYDANNNCRICGEHFSDAHQPSCPIELEQNDEY